MADVLDHLKAALADRYTIERELGRGGMATVYLAQDVKHERQVAVKVLRPELAAALGAERFLREIKITANLNHPHILPLLDSGSAEAPPDSPTDRPYAFLFYVMPYVEGESLRDRLNREKQLPIGDALKIASEVADALGFAHEHNVIHRDIKPENILLEGKHAVVTDFGVARAIAEAGETRLTETGIAIGTPAYLSPEQASGERDLDGRSDIYALGCVLYEMLAGEPPFTGPTAESIIHKHLTVEPLGVTSGRPTVPADVAAAVSKALAKAPADRFQTAEALGEAIAAAQLNLVTPSGGTMSGTARVDGATRRRWMMAGGAVGAAAIIAAIAAIAALPRGSGVRLDPNHVVVAAFRNETGDSSLDQLGPRIGHWVTQGIQQAAIPATPWETALQSWEYVQAEADAGRIRDPVRALAEETGAGIVISGAYYLEAESLEVQVDVVNAARGRSLSPLDPVRYSREATTEAIANTQQRVMGLLVANFDETLATMGGMGKPPSFEAYRAFSEGLRLELNLRAEDAIPYYRRAAELDSTWAPPLMRMVVAFNNLGRLAEWDSLLRVLEELEDRLTPYHRARVQYYRARYNGNPERALSTARQATDLAPGSPLVFNRAFMAMNTNRPREAIDALSTLDPQRGWLRAGGWRTYWYVLTNSLNMLGEHDRALDAARHAYRQHPDGGARLLFPQMEALAALGRIEEFNDVFNKIQAAHDLPWVRSALRFAVEALRAFGYLDEAEQVTEEALAWFEARTPGEHTDTDLLGETSDHRQSYGQLLFLAGRYDDAQQTFDALVDELPDSWSTRMTRAFIAASRGDTARALSDVHWFEALESRDGRPVRPWYELGVIMGALGDHQRAIELFREADRRGSISGYEFFRTDMHLDPLRDYPPFQEFMRPKG